MFVAVFVLALALSVSAQYGQQTAAPQPSCPQGMTMAPAYGTTCYNGGFYFNGVCCEVPKATTAAPSACPQGMVASPAYNGQCAPGSFLYQNYCCAPGAQPTAAPTANPGYGKK